jgi:hypothetical protein
MKNPVKKNMDYFNKPSVIEHSYEKEYLKLLDKENKKYSLLDRDEYLYDNGCDDNDIGCSTISID